MNKAVVAGWLVLLAWSHWILSPPAWAQGGWPPAPRGGLSVQPPCGDPPPEIEDPSPGDGNDCWEYKESDGWEQLFDCIEEIIECPEVTYEPVPGADCACLEIGDSKTFTFTKPMWGVSTGLKEIKPDDPDCGDAAEVEFTPGESYPWEVTGGEGVVAVSPRSGNDDAEFTATASGVGGADLTVTWRLILTMDEACPKEFSEPGPTAHVDVYEVVPDFPESGDCPELKKVKYTSKGFAYIPTPELQSTLHPLQVCFGDSCQRWRITGGVYVEFEDGVYRTHNLVDEPDCPPPLKQWDPVERDPDRINESKEHELKHCALLREDAAEINQNIVEPALGEIFDSQETCQGRIDELWKSILEGWKQCVQDQKNHVDFAGETRYDVECGDEVEDGTY